MEAKLKQILTSSIIKKRGSTAAPGWWTLGGTVTAVGAWAGKGAASQAASYINLANPGTYNLTTSSAPTWSTATGWTSDGTKWLDTVVTNGTNWSGMVRVGTVTAWGSAFAAYDGTNGFIMGSHYQSRRIYYNGDTGNRPPAGNDTSSDATYGVRGLYPYYNGVLDVASPAGNNAACTYSPYLLGQHGSSFSSGLTGEVVAAVLYNSVLSNAQMAALHTAMMAL